MVSLVAANIGTSAKAFGDIAVTGDIEVTGSIYGAEISAASIDVYGAITASGAVTAKTGAITADSIDSSENDSNITARGFITTYSGVGVLNAGAGAVLAQSADMNTDYNIDIHGALTAGDITGKAISAASINASGAITASGAVIAESGALTADSLDSSENNSNVTARGDITISSGVLDAGAGAVVAQSGDMSTDYDIDVAGALTAGDITGKAISAASIYVSGAIIASGAVSAESGTLTADSLDSSENNSNITARGNISIQNGVLNAGAGAVLAQSADTNTDYDIYAAGALTAGDITGKDVSAASIAASGAITASGEVASNTGISATAISAGGAVTARGAIETTSGDLDATGNAVTAYNLVDTYYDIDVAGALTASTVRGANIEAGSIVASDAITASGTIDSDAGISATAISAGGAVTADGGAITTTTGALDAAGNAVTAYNGTDTYYDIDVAGALTAGDIIGAAISAGAIDASGNITAASISSGVLDTGGDLTVTGNVTTTGELDAANLVVNGDAVLDTGANTATIGIATTIADTMTLSINSTGTTGLGEVSVDSGASGATLELTNNGTVELSGGDADYLTLRSVTTDGGTFKATDTLAAKKLDVDASTTLDATGGTITVGAAGGDADVVLGIDKELIVANNGTYAVTLNDIATSVGGTSKLTVAGTTGDASNLTIESVTVTDSTDTLVVTNNDTNASNSLSLGDAALAGTLEIAGAGTTTLDSIVADTSIAAGLKVASGSAITVGSTTVGNTTDTGETAYSGKAQLTVEASSDDSSKGVGSYTTNVELGDVELKNGTLKLVDSENSSVIYVGADSLSITGTSLLTGTFIENELNELVLAVDGNGDIDFTAESGMVLYYNSDRVALYGSDGERVGDSDILVAISHQDMKITENLTVTASDSYSGIEYDGDGYQLTVTGNGVTATVHGDSNMAGSTLDVTNGGRFTQINDGDTGAATDFTSTGTVNLDQGTLHFSNTGTNTIGTLAVAAGGGVLMGNAVTAGATTLADNATLDIDSSGGTVALGALTSGTAELAIDTNATVTATTVDVLAADTLTISGEGSKTVSGATTLADGTAADALTTLAVSGDATFAAINAGDYAKVDISGTADVTAGKLGVAAANGATLSVASGATFDNYSTEADHAATDSKSGVASGTFTVAGAGKVNLRGFNLGTSSSADGTLSYQNTNDESAIYCITANGNGGDEVIIGTDSSVNADLQLKKFDVLSAATITVATAESSLTIEGVTEGGTEKGLNVAANLEIANSGTVSIERANIDTDQTLTTTGANNITIKTLKLDGAIDNQVDAGYSAVEDVDTYAEIAALAEAQKITSMTAAGTLSSDSVNKVATAVSNASVATGSTLVVNNTNASGINAVGFEALTLSGKLDVNETAGETVVAVDNLNVTAAATGTIDVATTGGEVKVATTTVGQGGTLKLTDEDDTASVSLGAITLSGATLDITDADDDNASMVNIASITTNTDVSTIVAGTTDNVDKLAFSGDATLTLGTMLVYDSSEVVFTNSAGQILGNGNTDAEKIAEFNSRYTNLYDTNGVSGDKKEYTEGKTAVKDMTVDNTTKETTIDNGAEVVVTGTATVGAGETLKVDDGGKLVVTGTLNGGLGTVDLGGELQVSKDEGNNLNILYVTSDDSKVTGAGTVTVDDIIFEAKKLTVGAAVKIAGDVSDEEGKLTLTGDSTNEGTFDVNNNSATLAALEVASGNVATVTDTGGSGTFTLVNGATIDGHLNLAGGVNFNVASGALKISANTLDIGNGATVTVGDNAWIQEQTDSGENSHITVGAYDNDGNYVVTDDNAIASLDNQSNSSSNRLGLLDIGAGIGVGGSAYTELHLKNEGAGDSQLTIVTTNITGATAKDAILSVEKAETADKTNTVTLGTVNMNGLAVAANGTFVAGNASIWLYEGVTAGAGSVALTVNTLEVADGKFGTVYNDEETNAEATVVVANVGADSTLQLAAKAADTLTVNTLNLNGTSGSTATLRMGLAGSEYATIDSLVVASGKYGTIDNSTTPGTLNIKSMTVNGNLDLGSAWTMNANETINVGNAGTLVATGGVLNASAAGAKIVLNLGAEAQSAGNYATITTNTVKTSNAAGVVAGDTITNVYAQNGMAGQTYTDVFTDDLQDATGGAIEVAAKLNSSSAYKSYTLANAAGDGKWNDITVATNTSSIDNAVKNNGGSATAATAATYLISNEVSFDSTGQAYVNAMSNLSEPQFARAAEETIGEEATTQTVQNSLMGISASTTAVSNQMTSFRSGNIAAGMASSFNSAGATAALSDMADAETLAEAYEAGFTSGSDCEVYKKVQVWANGFGGFGEQGTDGTMIGYDFWNIGTMVGLDYAFAKELRVGALFGYSYNSTDVYWGAGDSTDNLLRFGAYASYNWDNFFVDLSPTMGVHILESKRNIWNGATAKGDRTGVDFNISGTVGYTFNLPADIQLTPSYSLGYTLFYDPEYTETGAGAANVKYNSFTSNSLLQDLGVRLGKLIRTSDDLAFLPEVWGGWEVEYLNTGGTRNTTTTASIGSQTYGTTMNSMATNRAYWGLGLTALIKDNVSVFGRYDQKIWDKGYNVGFTAGVKVSF